MRLEDHPKLASWLLNRERVTTRFFLHALGIQGDRAATIVLVSHKQRVCGKLKVAYEDPLIVLLTSEVVDPGVEYF